MEDFDLKTQMPGDSQGVWKDEETNQIHGFMVKFEKLFTFATVRGAGHEVPSYRPLAALDLLKKFLDGSKAARPPWVVGCRLWRGNEGRT